MRLTRFAALLAFVSFAVAIPAGKVTNDVAARAEEARALYVAPELTLTKRNYEARALEDRQLGGLLSGLLGNIPILGPLLAGLLGGLGRSQITMEELRSGAKTLKDVADESGVSLKDLQELFNYLPAGTIADKSVHGARSLEDRQLGGLLSGLLPLISGLPILGPILSSLLGGLLGGLGRTQITMDQLKSGAKTLKDVADETGVSLKDLQDLFAMLPAGTIADKSMHGARSLEDRQLSGLLGGLLPLLSGLPILGPILSSLLGGLLGGLGRTQITMDQLKSGAKTLKDVADETGVSLKDLQDLFNLLPAGTVADKSVHGARSLEDRQLSGLLGGLLPLISGLPILGPILSSLLGGLLGGLGRTQITMDQLKSGAKTLKDVADETDVSLKDLQDLFALLPAGTIADKSVHGARALEDRQLGDLLGGLLPLLSGIPIIGPLLSSLLGGLGRSQITISELQSGAKTLKDVADETGVSLKDLQDLFSLLPAGTIADKSVHGARSLEDRQLSGLLGGLLPLLSGLPIVGPILSSLLGGLLGGLGRTQITMEQLKSGAKTLKDVADETGVSLKDLQDIFNLLPAGTIADKSVHGARSLEDRQLSGLLGGLLPLLSGLPIVGPILSSLLGGLLGGLGRTQITMDQLKSGAKTLKDVADETGVSLKDLQSLFSLLPAGTIADKSVHGARSLEDRQLGDLLGGLLPLLSGIPIIGPLLSSLLGGLGRSQITISELQSGAKTLKDVADETGVSLKDLQSLFNLLPAGTIADKSLHSRQLAGLGSLVQSLVPLLSGIPVVGPLLTTVLSLVSSAIPLRDLQTGARTLEDVSKETGVSLDDLKTLFNLLPAGTVADKSINPRQLAGLGSLVQSLVPVLSGIPVVGPLLTTVLSLVSSAIPLRDLQTGARTLEDVSKETGVSLDDLKTLFSHIPAGVVA